MRTVLISAASSLIGSGITKSLEKEELRVIGTSTHEKSIANYWPDIFELAPVTGSNGYLDWLNDLIDKYSIDLLIPGLEDDVIYWNKHREDIKTRLALNRSSLIELCVDKYIFYQKLFKKYPRYSIPTLINNNLGECMENFSFPFILKARKGNGSKKFTKVEKESDYIRDSSLIAQYCVGSDEEEYTVGVFCDRLGIPLTMFNMARCLTNGYTGYAETVDIDEELERTIRDLCKLFKPVGATNFQFRKFFDGYKLLEINPRISSSTSIRAKFGYNESKMMVDLFLNDSVSLPTEIKRGKAIRYIEDYIIYE